MTTAIKNPVEWFDWGADLRVRDERFPNAIIRSETIDDPIREWLRIRTRVWGNIKPTEDVAIRTRITNESRIIRSPDDYSSANPHDNYDHFDEVIVDNLYLEWRQPLEWPMVVRFFRQDMLAIPGTTGPNGTGFGDGFIFMDGTPGDGSRSFYFDALRITMDLSDWIENSSIDLLGIENVRFGDDHFPIIGGSDYRSLTDSEGDNYTYGFYFKNASWVPNSQLDAYYLYSQTDDFEAEDWERPGEKGAYWNTIGGRMSGNLAQQTKYVAELAYQFGRGNNRTTDNIEDHSAWGGQASLTQMLQEEYNISLKGYGVYLSGDDPDTDDFEGWRALYNRWPKWGELIGYMGPREDGIYYFTNMVILGAQLNFNVSESWSVMALYQYLWALENTYGENVSIFGDGKGRGHNPQIQIAWSPTTAKWFKSHVRLEYFDEGDYFGGPVQGKQLDYYFARWEVYFRF
jgi:hypothetical protein